MPQPARLPAPEPTEKEILLQRIEDLEKELMDVRERYEAERTDRILSLQNAPEVKRLYAMLCVLFDCTPGYRAASPQPANSTPDSNSPLDPRKYEPWKAKFGPREARIIDALITYEGGLTRQALVGFTKITGGTDMKNALYKLTSAGVIERVGDLIRLKRF